MLEHIAAGSAIALGWIAQLRRAPKELSEEKCASYRHVYQQAMTGKDIEAKLLRDLSAEFRKVGWSHEADMLIKRAQLREAPREIKDARKAALTKLLNCDDIALVRHAADVHEDMGAFGAAFRLREYADGLAALAHAKSTAAAEESSNGNPQ